MVLKYALTNIPYTLEDVKLGSLVPNPARPNQDTYCPKTKLAEHKDFKWRNQRNFSFLQSLEKESFIRSQLTRLFSVSGDRSKGTNKELWSKEGRVYELSQPKECFKQMIKSRAAKTWLEQAHDNGEDVHFVVGYRTFFDSTEADSKSAQLNVAAKLRAPIQEIAAGGVGTAAGDLLDPEIAAGHSSRLYQEESFEIPGERIFAIEFRKVRFKWRDPGSVSLEADNAWVVTSDVRGEDEEAMMVEVDLEDVELGHGVAQTIQSEGRAEEYYHVPQ